jgi:Ca-activated chloride channel family protein
VTALVESLTDHDHLELIEFSNKPHRWRAQPVLATAIVRKDALLWLAAIQASGGTEMLEGIKEALRPLRAGAQRQVVLVTDGLVGFETEIVSTVARDLPATCRLHAVAIGSAPNQALTGPAARAGRGTEVAIDLTEEPEAAIARLLAHMQAPVLIEVMVDGRALLGHAPARLPDVYAGAPLRLAVKLRAEGGELVVRGTTPSGPWEERVVVPAVAHGEGSSSVVALYAREAVEDLEMQEVAGLVSGVDAEIERIGLAFQIATRRSAWVAVSEEPTVDPAAPTRRERIPHALPHGMSAEGLGLRPPRFSANLIARCSLMESHPAPSLHAIPAHKSSASERLLRRILAHSPRALSARLILRQDRELILEIEVAEPLDWYARDVRVFWEDGREVAAAIIEGTTRPGTVVAGQVIRLVLRLDADGPSEAPIRIEMKSLDKTLDLRIRS